MQEIKRKISKEDYDRYDAMGRFDMCNEIEKTLSPSIICGYGYYGCRLYEEDGEYFCIINIGSSCD